MSQKTKLAAALAAAIALPTLFVFYVFTGLIGTWMGAVVGVASVIAIFVLLRVVDRHCGIPSSNDEWYFF